MLLTRDDETVDDTLTRLGCQHLLSPHVRQMFRRNLSLTWREWQQGNSDRLAITLQGGHTLDFFRSRARGEDWAREMGDVYEEGEHLESGARVDLFPRRVCLCVTFPDYSKQHTIRVSRRREEAAGSSGVVGTPFEQVFMEFNVRCKLSYFFVVLVGFCFPSSPFFFSSQAGGKDQTQR